MRSEITESVITNSDELLCREAGSHRASPGLMVSATVSVTRARRELGGNGMNGVQAEQCGKGSSMRQIQKSHLGDFYPGRIIKDPLAGCSVHRRLALTREPLLHRQDTEACQDLQRLTKTAKTRRPYWFCASGGGDGF